MNRIPKDKSLMKTKKRWKRYSLRSQIGKRKKSTTKQGKPKTALWLAFSCSTDLRIRTFLSNKISLV
jgi:hypothetical protein